MVSTVTVSDETRRKIKRLAALLDTTQNKIVERAVALLEREILKEREKKKKLSPKVKKALEEAKRIVKEKDPEFYEHIMQLTSSEIDIDDVISERWGDEI